MNQLGPEQWTRGIGTTTLLVVLIGGLIGYAVAEEPSSTDGENLFPGKGESPTWAVDTERYQGEADAPRRPTRRSVLSTRVKIVLAAGLLILHLLLGIVVFVDLRRSSPKMSGLWIWIVVLGGVLAAIAYALFRRNRLIERRNAVDPGEEALGDR